WEQGPEAHRLTAAGAPAQRMMYGGAAISGDGAPADPKAHGTWGRFPLENSDLWALAAAGAPPISQMCRPNRAAHTERTRFGPHGRTIPMSLNTEDMRCVRLILLPSIVRPSALTGCFPFSTKSPVTAPRVIRPTTSSGPARTTTVSR